LENVLAGPDLGVRGSGKELSHGGSVSNVQPEPISFWRLAPGEKVSKYGTMVLKGLWGKHEGEVGGYQNFGKGGNNGNSLWEVGKGRTLVQRKLPENIPPQEIARTVR